MAISMRRERIKVGGGWIQGVHVFQVSEFGLASIPRRDRFPRNQLPKGPHWFL